MGQSLPRASLQVWGKDLKFQRAGNTELRVTFHPGVGLKKVTQGASEIVLFFFLAWVVDNPGFTDG